MIVALSLIIVLIGYFIISYLWPSDKVDYAPAVFNSSEISPAAVGSLDLASSTRIVVSHVETPDPLKAVYMTSWAAGNDRFRKELFDLVDNTEINAVVIDVKDYSGKVSFPVEDPYLKEFKSSEKRIPDIKELIAKLHAKGVYVIGRISAFQDSYLVKDHPEWAVKTKEGGVWQDHKAVKWLDPGAKPVWDYLVAIGRQSYAYGFDELNFDYIRYPSDGDMQNIAYSWSDGLTRQEVMRSFFLYLREQFSGTEIPLSVDLFGLTTSAEGDLGIGQNLDDALTYFDYVSPMIYPSHFARGFIGYAKPAEHPYEVIKYALDHASARALAASTTPSKIRPWLQAFDLGAIYTPAMVRSQIQATNDAGLNSWLLWNAGSVYDKAALVPKGEEVASSTGR